ncbi:carbonic anhydrase 6 [Sorex araneus]|uniref:carbonic anhydrase 6 n=1 Tax=Sorex araneus TaxID=42254 RepID=UPI00243371C7|nr:carbonic anhydrase 6 [Sorex araneus]XP_054993565.1 carbonic anhydrase 6 [Sorex araneus]
MNTLVALLSLFLLEVRAQHGPEWTYSEGALDKAHWATEYPDCGGRRQSPINLQRKKVRYNPDLLPLTLTGYGAQEGSFTMTNNGHTVQISLPDTMRLVTSDGSEYIAQQMHFHWGGASSEISGSEHTVDGKRHVAEVHVVHYNSKYPSFNVAQSSPDGLAVLAAVFKVQEYSENTYYSNFISHLQEIRYPGQSTVLKSLDIMDMLPENLENYYTYQGSLTTPPCTENVLWFLLKDTVQVSKAQIFKLENTLLDHNNKTLHNDYRMTQPLYERVVEANFEYFPSDPELHFQAFVNKMAALIQESVGDGKTEKPKEKKAKKHKKHH